VPQTNAARKIPPARKASLRVLIADDELDALRLLGIILRRDGHVVYEATHAPLVLYDARRFKPDVCILDIQMPGKTGYELAREISAAYKGNPPLLVAISGRWSSGADVYAAKDAGFRHFLKKPVHPETLLGILDEYEYTLPQAA